MAAGFSFAIEARDDDARVVAEELRERVEVARETISTFDGPEIFHTLQLVIGDDSFRAAAREMVENRARPIRNDSYREHFLTRRWPNCENTGGPPDDGPPA